MKSVSIYTTSSKLFMVHYYSVIIGVYELYKLKQNRTDKVGSFSFWQLDTEKYTKKKCSRKNFFLSLTKYQDKYNSIET